MYGLLIKGLFTEKSLLLAQYAHQISVDGLPCGLQRGHLPPHVLAFCWKATTFIISGKGSMKSFW